jgi:hypothetical protein
MKKSVIILVSLIIVSFNVNSQNSGPSNLRLIQQLIIPISITKSTLDSIANPLNLLTPADSLKLSVSMSIPDLSNIETVHLKLGTSLGSSDLLALSFQVDGTNLASQYTFVQNGNFVKVLLGVYPKQDYYLEVYLVDSQGTNSATSYYQTN